MILHFMGINIFLFHLFYFVDVVFIGYSLINYKELYNKGPYLLYNYFIYVSSLFVINGILAGIWSYKFARFIKRNCVNITNKFLNYITILFIFLNLAVSIYSIYYKTLFDEKTIEFYDKSYKLMWYNFNILYYYNLVFISNVLFYILLILIKYVSNKLFNKNYNQKYIISYNFLINEDNTI